MANILLQAKSEVEFDLYGHSPGGRHADMVTGGVLWWKGRAY